MAAYSGTPDAVDFSFDSVPGKTLQANGIDLAGRYLSHTPEKNLTKDEAADLRSHGVGILLNWESGAGRPLLGADAGANDGRDAAAMAESLGAPHGLTIYYSCDRDVNSSQYDAIAAYYAAAKRATAGRYRVGVYGEFEIIEELHRRGVVDGEWQTYAWSGGRLSIQTDLYQYLNGQRMAGAAVDYDHIIHAADLGAWWPAGSPNNIAGGLMPSEAEEIKAQIHAFAEEYRADQAKVEQALDGLKDQQHAAAVQSSNRDTALAKALGDASTPVNVPELAAALASDLGPDIGNQLLAALAAALAPK